MMGAQNQFSTNESTNQTYSMYNEFSEQPPGTELQQPTMTTSHQSFGSMNQNIGSMNQTNETWPSQMNRGGGGTWYNQVPQTVEQAPIQSQQAQINAMVLWTTYQQALNHQELLMQRLAADGSIATDDNFIKQIEDTATLVRTLGQQVNLAITNISTIHVSVSNKEEERKKIKFKQNNIKRSFFFQL
ncbi:hypothetical protein RFI_17979 [Reticulomyxa filosa]|uniref:Uncharacterized protein n=1 Tax=Reticulomyxa filosa TaxID=46433 RepID=X6MZJ6_RETFI|nr:hypothetical protein RFI_17979 [Reticulomyxa filosa]|eukprot:ETO19251.1 hypothetical protein RFI_17979 [Reticulomyxa filosa]